MGAGGQGDGGVGGRGGAGGSLGAGCSVREPRGAHCAKCKVRIASRTVDKPAVKASRRQRPWRCVSGRASSAGSCVSGKAAVAVLRTAVRRWQACSKDKGRGGEDGALGGATRLRLPSVDSSAAWGESASVESETGSAFRVADCSRVVCM